MTREYTEFCRRAFGRYLHHSPDTTLAVPMHHLHEHTLRIVDEHALPLTLFTADADAGLENGYRWTSSDLIRMRRATDELPRRRRRGATSDVGTSGFWGGGFFGGCAGGGGDGGGGGGCGGGGCGGGG